ncbi:MAG: hypothetical protein WB709_07055, partial [Solirubrobacteraceae bacterium]
LEEVSLAAPDDAPALAGAIARVLTDPDIARRGLERVGALCAPGVLARTLAGIYKDSSRGEVAPPGEGAAGTLAGT